MLCVLGKFDRVPEPGLNPPLIRIQILIAWLCYRGLEPHKKWHSAAFSRSRIHEAYALPNPVLKFSFYICQKLRSPRKACPLAQTFVV